MLSACAMEKGTSASAVSNLHIMASHIASWLPGCPRTLRTVEPAGLSAGTRSAHLVTKVALFHTCKSSFTSSLQEWATPAAVHAAGHSHSRHTVHIHTHMCAPADTVRRGSSKGWEASGIP